MQPTMLKATVGRTAHAVTPWQQVSEAYTAALNASGLGVSQAPPCHIVDDFGNLVAHVSYNGRVWNKKGNLLFDPRSH